MEHALEAVRRGKLFSALATWWKASYSCVVAARTIGTNSSKHCAALWVNLSPGT